MLEYKNFRRWKLDACRKLLNYLTEKKSWQRKSSTSETIGELGKKWRRPWQCVVSLWCEVIHSASDHDEVTCQVLKLNQTNFFSNTHTRVNSTKILWNTLFIISIWLMIFFFKKSCGLIGKEFFNIREMGIFKKPPSSLSLLHRTFQKEN